MENNFALVLIKDMILDLKKDTIRQLKKKDKDMYVGFMKIKN